MEVEIPSLLLLSSFVACLFYFLPKFVAIVERNTWSDEYFHFWLRFRLSRHMFRYGKLNIVTSLMWITKNKRRTKTAVGWVGGWRHERRTAGVFSLLDFYERFALIGFGLDLDRLTSLTHSAHSRVLIGRASVPITLTTNFMAVSERNFCWICFPHGNALLAITINSYIKWPA